MRLASLFVEYFSMRKEREGDPLHARSRAYTIRDTLADNAGERERSFGVATTTMTRERERNGP